MVMLCQKFFQQVNLSDWILENLTQINVMITVGEVAFQKSILNLHRNYKICRISSRIILSQLHINQKSIIEILSDYQIKIADDFDISFGYDRKLVPNFFDKEKYMLHHRNLQLCLRLGLKTKKVHRVLEFNQSK